MSANVSKTPYGYLSRPLVVGHVRLKNRIMMGSMHTGLEDSWNGFQKLAEFYEERARNGVAMIVTGGMSPDFRGRLSLFSSQFSSRLQLGKHRKLVARVKQHGTAMCLQILHAGRYAYHPFAVAPSAIKSPITPFTPRALSERQIIRIIAAYVKTARLAKRAGYDGVEIMGSEGYLINQFICRNTNQRTDHWGGEYGNRIRFPLEIIRAIRRALGPDFLIIYRLSMLDLQKQGSSWQEIVQLARAVEQAGASMLNTGIGWHEVRIPTIASTVPQAAFSWVTRNLMAEVSIPVIASNRFNTPESIEYALRQGDADMISMARPFLADGEFVSKTLGNESALINHCIACNQGCLDRVFSGRRATCMVNPRACYETEYPVKKTDNPKDLVVVGMGVAGMAFAYYAALRGHRVVIYDAGEAGGQFNLAAQIPGKREYARTIRYFENQLDTLEVVVHRHKRLDFEQLRDIYADAIVLATGVRPRKPAIPGIDHFSVMDYETAIQQHRDIGKQVAIIGAGGIGFDVAELLVAPANQDLEGWLRSWGIDREYRGRGGLLPEAEQQAHFRTVYLLQRKNEKIGKHLARTTGWIKRLILRKQGVEMLSGVRYLSIDDFGLHIQYKGKKKTLAVDQIIICAGQEPENDLYRRLKAIDQPVYVIGGSYMANELDAESAIRQGMELAYRL